MFNPHNTISRKGLAMSFEVAPRNWKYPFYAVTFDKMYVMGFTDRSECDSYALKHGFRTIAYKTALNSGKNPRFLDNWTDTYPEDGVEGEIDL